MALRAFRSWRTRSASAQFHSERLNRPLESTTSENPATPVLHGLDGADRSYRLVSNDDRLEVEAPDRSCPEKSTAGNAPVAAGFPQRQAIGLRNVDGERLRANGSLSLKNRVRISD